MMTGIVKDTRELMVRTALELLRERGYAGMSFGDVIERSGAPRGSIYHHFPGGKQQLVTEAVTLYAERIRERLATAVHSGSSLDAVRTLIDVTRDGLRASDFRAGCAIAAVVLDVTPEDRVLLDLSAASLGGWRGVLATGFRRDGATAAQARRLAALVVGAVEGALILARADRDVTPVVDIGHELESHLRTTLPAPPS